MKRTLQELTIKDDFLFGAVMLEEANCRRLLELAAGISVRSVEVRNTAASGWTFTRRMRKIPATTWRCRW